MITLALNIPADHPAFAGHFPGRPIVPGVVLLDQAQLLIEAACGVRISGLAMAKFLSPVSPGEALWLDFEANGRFEIRAAERKIASGRFTLLVPDLPSPLAPAPRPTAGTALPAGCDSAEQCSAQPCLAPQAGEGNGERRDATPEEGA